MTEQEKHLFLIDLCARLPYGVRVKIFDESILLVGNNEKGILDGKENMSDDCFVIKCKNDSWIISCDDFKPYLRPMSNMTEDEKELMKGSVICFNEFEGNSTLFDEIGLDWLLAHHFDFRGLIEKGLALEAPEGMYK